LDLGINMGIVWYGVGVTGVAAQLKSDNSWLVGWSNLGNLLSYISITLSKTSWIMDKSCDVQTQNYPVNNM
jgi:hypothetical protein